MANGSRKRAVATEDGDYEGPVESPKRRATNSAATSRGGKAQPLAQNKKAQRATQTSNKSEAAVPPAEFSFTPPKNAAIIDLCLVGRPKKLVTPCHAFPRMNRAEVAIILSKDPQYNYQLHFDILSKSSVWFKDTLSYEPEEYDDILAADMKKYTGLGHRYELEHDPASSRWLLVKTNLTMPKGVKVDDTPIKSTSTVINEENLQSPKSMQRTTLSKENDTESTGSPVIISGDEESGDSAGPEKQDDGEPKAIKEEDEEKKNAITEDQGAATQIKIENDNPTSSADTNADKKATLGANIITQTDIDLEDTFAAYNNLFLAYYNLPLVIDTDNISFALHKAELLLNISEFYGSTHVVRPLLKTILHEYGRELYKAILRDPPRWLFLAIQLECAPIFKEAVIHVVGNHPHWPSELVPRSKFDTETLKCLDKKVDDLQSVRAKVNEALFMSTLLVDGKEVCLNKANKSVLDTWVTVQLWRDWDCRSLNRTKASRDFKNIDARMYRTMAKGDDAYLAFDDVKTWREEYKVATWDCAQWDTLELKEDLKIMKQYAQKQVQPLVENNSILSVEEECIEYFTCTKVENDELPWVKKAATPVP